MRKYAPYPIGFFIGLIISWRMSPMENLIFIAALLASYLILKFSNRKSRQ